jgi:hypothetical protein
MDSKQDFSRQVDRDEEGQIRVKSTCIYCGISRLGSVVDGSIEQWEAAHQCKRQSFRHNLLV